MELLASARPSSPPLPVQNHRKTPHSSSSAAPFLAVPFHNFLARSQTAPVPTSISFNRPKDASAVMQSVHNHFTHRLSLHHKVSALLNSTQEHMLTRKTASSTKKFTAHLRILKQNPVLATKTSLLNRIPGANAMQSLPLLRSFLKLQLQLSVISVFSVPLPSFASELEEVSGKINLESILISIDNFFNRYPFFVASVTFVWLVIIPLTQEYMKKYKYISAINAFRKLKEDPKAQLLDIRKKQSVANLDSPNLKILNKSVVQVEFSEGREDTFVKEVLKNFQDPSNTVVCVLDNFDGDSLKVAELLFNNGFKEAYAIKGGVRGKDGWQAIQETLLPPSVHVYTRKRTSSSEVNIGSERINNHYSGNNKPQISLESPQGGDDGQREARQAASGTNNSKSSLSPYPNYPDLKPPSSPSPSKPQ